MSNGDLYATLPEEAITAIRKREQGIEAIRQGNIAARVNGNGFEIGQSVDVPIGPFDQLAGKITQVLGKNVEVLLEIEFLGRRAITVAAGKIISRD